MLAGTEQNGKPLTKTEFDWQCADAYLFDIDGTLMNCSDGVHYRAFLSTLEKVYGVNSSLDGIPVHGNTDVGILQAVTRHQGISDADFEDRLPAAMAMMAEEATSHASEMSPKICPSIEDLLHLLCSQGKLLGIVSGNLEPIAWMKLNAAGLRDYFSFGRFSGQLRLREDIFRNGLAEVSTRLGSTAKTIFLGDTPADVQAAKTLRTPIVALATGIYSKQVLEEYAPDLCLSCCSELMI